MQKNKDFIGNTIINILYLVVICKLKIGEKQIVEIKKTLSDLCSNLLVLIAQLQKANDLGDPENLRRRFLRLFTELDREGRELNIDSEDVNDVKFALAVFVDEVILSSQWHGKDAWQLNKTLAVEYFNSFNAGQEFYDKLDAIKAKAHTRIEVLEVYYLCLSLGFKGQYSLYGAEKMKFLLDEVYEDIRHSQKHEAEDLSPHWQRPRTDEFVGNIDNIPVWAIVLGGACLAILLFLILQASLVSSSSKVIDEFAKLLS